MVGRIRLAVPGRGGWVRRAVCLIAAASLAAITSLATPALAQASMQDGGDPPTWTPKRRIASSAMLVALTAVVAGGVGLARARSGAGNGRGRGPAVAASVLAPAGLLAGAIVVATAGGGVGTGNGLAGGVIAMIMGAIGMVLGGLGLRRARRAG